MKSILNIIKEPQTGEIWVRFNYHNNYKVKIERNIYDERICFSKLTDDPHHLYYEYKNHFLARFERER